MNRKRIAALLAVACLLLLCSCSRIEEGELVNPGKEEPRVEETLLEAKQPEEVPAEEAASPEAEQPEEEENFDDEMISPEEMEEALATALPSDPAGQEGKEYFIKVNCQMNTVTIYGRDEEGNYTQPTMAMICSTGTDTPQSGVYDISRTNRWEWLGLKGNVNGYYVTQISGNILFHSVPYLTRYDPSSLEYWEFDKLGTACSLGCIRLQVKDALWIYENQSLIAGVEFYNSAIAGPLGKPTAAAISSNTQCRGWDPTDPNPNNPWLSYQEDNT